MYNESNLSFGNYLMTLKLDDLLPLMDMEMNHEKRKQIERTIYLKVNYLDDNNQKLSFKEAYFHKKELRKRYRASQYEKYIIFNKKLNKINIFSIIIAIVIFIIGYNYRNEIPLEILHKKYMYRGKEITEKNLETLLDVRIYLGKLHEKKEKNTKAYLAYLEAKEISEILKKNEKVVSVEKNLSRLYAGVHRELLDEIGKLKFEKDLESPEYKINIARAIGKAQELNMIEAIGYIYEIQGDLAIEEFSLIKARNFFLLASKFNKDDEEILNKIKVVDKLQSFIERAEKIKIVELIGNREEVEAKYEELEREFNSFDIKYQLPQLKKFLERD